MKNLPRSHIRGARNLPLERLSESLEGLKRFKDKPVIVYCEHGGSAGSAMRQLAQQGFAARWSICAAV